MPRNLRRLGNARENEIKRKLEECGCYVIASRRSQGEFDLVALPKEDYSFRPLVAWEKTENPTVFYNLHPVALCIQVKGKSTGGAKAACAAVKFHCQRIFKFVACYDKARHKYRFVRTK